MSEIDLTTKIEGLKKAIAEHEEMRQAHLDSLSKVEKELADINKPAITSALMEEIEGAVEKAVEDFDFSDDDNFDKEFEMDYDNRVRLSNLEFNNSCDLVAEIAEKVLNLFREEDASEEETTTDNS